MERKLSALVAILLLVGLHFSAKATDPTDPCEKQFTEAAEPQWDRSSEYQRWRELRRVLLDRVKNAPSPMLEAGFNPVLIGAVFKAYREAIPEYTSFFERALERGVSVDTYEELKALVLPIVEDRLVRARVPATEIYGLLDIVSRMNTWVGLVSETADALETDSETNSNSGDDEGGDEIEESGGPTPPWSENDDSENYDPENKSLSSGGEGKKEILLLTDAIPTDRLLPETIYDETTANGFRSNPMIRTRRAPTSKEPTAVLRMRPLGSDLRVAAAIASGYEVDLRNTSGVKKNAIEQVVVRLKPDVHEISIPLIDRRSEPEFFQTPAARDAYLVPTGIPESAWPARLVTEMNAIKVRLGPSPSPLRVAREVRAFVKSNFYYYSVSREVSKEQLKLFKRQQLELERRFPKAKALVFAHLGAVNCDGASLLGSVILRDFFQVVARAVAGRTVGGKIQENGIDFYASLSGDPLHMWLEVWDHGAWRVVDMTPDHPTEAGSSAELPEELMTLPSDSSSSEGQAEENRSSEAQDAQNPESSEDAQKDRSETPLPAPEARVNGAEDALDAQDPTNALLEGLKSERSGRAAKLMDESFGFFDSVAELLEVFAVERSLEDATGVASIERHLAGLRRLFSEPEENAVLQVPFWGVASDSAGLAQRLHQLRQRYQDKGTGSWRARLMRIRRAISERQFLDAFQDLQSLLLHFRELELRRPLLPREGEFSRELGVLYRAFYDPTLRHEQSPLFSLVETMSRELPGPLSRAWIRNRYGADAFDLGSPAFEVLANAIKSGSLASILRIQNLRDYGSIVTRVLTEERYREDRTFERAERERPRAQDVVVARSLEEFPRMILDPQPGEHLFAPFMRDEQYAMGTLRRIRRADPRIKRERKHTLVFLDQSGSMGGAVSGGLSVADFQQSLMLTFLDTIAADVDPITGELLHTAEFFAFDTDVVPLRRIDSLEDAQDFFNSLVGFRASGSGGGTDIQKALIKGLEEIARAYQDSEAFGSEARLLQAANIVILTDGEEGGQIEEERLRQIRATIPSSVSVKINFFKFGDGSSSGGEALMKFARENHMAAPEQVARTLKVSEMSAVIDRSARPPLDPHAFFARPEVRSAPPGLLRALNQVDRSASALSLGRDASDQRIAELSRSIGRIEDVSLQTKLDYHFNDFGKRIESLSHLSISERRRLYEHVLSVLPQYRPGRNLSQLPPHQYVTIERIRRWAGL